MQSLKQHLVLQYCRMYQIHYIIQMLKAEDISFSYSKRTLLDSVDFSVRKGEKVVITGKNGTGKSTFAHILAGIISPTNGSISINGKEPKENQVNIVLQNPEDSLISSLVERELSFPLENLAFPEKEIELTIHEYSEKFGLSDYLIKSPSQLSGGMKARLAIAVAMITKPDFLILDEPASFLDFSGKIALFNILNQLAEDGVGIIYITQIHPFIKWADNAYVLEDGKLLKINKDTDTISKKEYELSRESSSFDNKAKNVISLSNASFSYFNKIVFEDLDLNISDNSVIAIMGSSGSGKSTLINILAKLFSLNKGKIENNLRNGVIFQFPEMQLFAETVIEDVEFGPKNFNLTNPRNISEKCLVTMNVDEKLWDRNPYSLSMGESRRVGIAGVLAIEPDILIFDEPSASLDPLGCQALISIIKAYKASSKTVIIVSHNLDFLENIAERAIVIDNGKIVYDSDFSSLVENRELLESFGLGRDEWVHEKLKIFNKF